MTGESEILQATPGRVNNTAKGPLRPVIAATLAGAALRLAYLWLHEGGALFATWQDPDPDGYVAAAERLLAGGRWRWSFDAVAYGNFVKAPLYPVFVSIVRGWPGFPLTAFVVQALAGAAAVAGVFLIGRALHSTRAGVLAAFVYAVWLPAIVAVPTFFQEQIAVPLTIAGLGLLLDGYRGNRRTAWIAGTALTLAAASLARAMPLYLLALTLLGGRWLLPRDGRRAVLTAIALAVAFTVPYSIAVSRARHDPILVENVGFIHLAFNDPPGRTIAPPSGTAVGALQAARILGAQTGADPLLMSRRLGARIRDLLQPHSTLGLPLMTIAGSERAATWLKAATHLWDDIPLVAVWLLAPFGLVFARNSRAAAVVAVWIVAAMLLTALTGLTGPRYRAVLDPLAIALAAAAVCGGPARRGVRPAAAAASIAGAAAFLSFAPAVVRARSDVGVSRWILDADGARSTRLNAYGAFTVVGDDGPVWLRVQCVSGIGAVEVRAGLHRLAAIDPRDCAGGRRIDLSLAPRQTLRITVSAPQTEVAVTLMDRRVETAIMASAARRTHRPLRSTRGTARRSLPPASAPPAASPS
jgi:hypothetical protein